MQNHFKDLCGPSGVLLFCLSFFMMKNAVENILIKYCGD